MRFDIISIFPEVFAPYLSASILGRASQEGVVEYKLHDLKEHGLGNYNKLDDQPYGGGTGQVLRLEPIVEALESIELLPKALKIIFSPRGQKLTQSLAREKLSKVDQLILVCPRYEGFDERIMNFVDLSISIGDYVLTGGELPAMVLLDTVTRLLPGTFRKGELVTALDSFSDQENLRLEAPQYTKPREFRGHKVPEVLLSGDHKRIEQWRHYHSQ